MNTKVWFKLSRVIHFLFLSICIPLSSCHGGSQDITQPGDHVFSLRFDKYKRTYRVHIPPGFTTETPTPVVLVFHGGLGTGKVIQKQSKMNKVSDTHGFIAVFPDGLYRTWNAGGCCEKAMRKNIDDVGFVIVLIDELQQKFNIDPYRVFATGFSNGAMLSHRLACELSEKIAAIAPVSGVIMIPTCNPTRPMSAMVFHGTDDPRSLWEGGIGDKNPRKGSRPSIPSTISTLRNRYHCPTSTETLYEKGEATCVSHNPCDGNNEVVLCKITGGGHQWPGGIPIWTKKLGAITKDISASEAMWSFFQNHPISQ